MITQLAVSGYRSLRDIVLPLGQLTIITGANGSGKSSLYRALRLLSDVAQGRVVGSLAAEGGLASTLWAGPEKFSRGIKDGLQPVQGLIRKQPVSLKLGFASEDYGYAIDLGLSGALSRFSSDPEIKAEAVWVGEMLRPSNLIAERKAALTRMRIDKTGEWRDSFGQLSGFDSMMTHYADPSDGLELLLLRERMRQWRFYDELRTDREAPARRPQIGTFTPILSSDGSDLGAAVQTIIEIGEEAALQDAIADAFGGAKLTVNDRFEVEMHQRGLLRPLNAAELSDGTLRYIMLVAALLSPRPPELMILNEPETSLHPDLLIPLARLLNLAARQCQIVVVSHAANLVTTIAAGANSESITLEKYLGETVVRDVVPSRWQWPMR